MYRFCDYISIYRKKGDIYNPFPGEKEGESDIYNELVYEGECKGEVSMNGVVAEDMVYTIYINDNNVQADNRDIAYFKTNNEGDAIKLVIWDVKRYEHNTIIRATHIKDGDNTEQ